LGRKTALDLGTNKADRQPCNTGNTGGLLKALYSKLVGNSPGNTGRYGDN